jgi:ABC-2 type transport system ATP-binding protein/lipopolysaccharide transport system ATP-binding protein
VVPLLSLNIGLSPDLTAKENFLLRALALGLDRQIIELMENNIRSFSELGEFFDLPIKTYSSGMTMRLALGMAIATEPEILLVDEWLMAGDASFLLKSKQRIEKFISGAKVLVLASHSEDIIREWCNKAILMKEGRILFSGNVNDAFKIYDQISTID